MAEATKTISIRRPTDEHVEFYIDGESLASANHDEDGWAGMRAIEQLIRKMAGIFGARVVEDGSEVETAGEAPTARVTDYYPDPGPGGHDPAGAMPGER